MQKHAQQALQQSTPPPFIHTTDVHALAKYIPRLSKCAAFLLRVCVRARVCVWVCTTGFWYRPWMRQVTFLLFTCISIVSMILGFYDLYKNVPIVRQAMSALAAHIFPPAQQLFEWLERHAQIRYVSMQPDMPCICDTL